MKKYELRIWLGSNAKIEDDTMNKTYKSKIVVDTSFKSEGGIGGSTTPGEQTNPTIELGTDIPPVENGDGLYAVSHNNLDKLGQEWNKIEYRYVGVNPNNYVSFNDEIWRVIGLVNVKVGESVEQRLKIVRTEDINNQKKFGKYKFDNKNEGVGSSDSFSGSNDWTDSQLKDMLNGIYYESGIGDCYNGNSLSQCDFSTGTVLPKGINQTARDMVDKDVIWNLGGWNDAEISVKEFYEKERGISVYSGKKRFTEWSNVTDVGEKHNGIGLIYPSDYGYATNGGSLGRDKCLDTILGYNGWYTGSYLTECANKDWLKNSNGMWTLTPDSSFSYSNYVIYLNNNSKKTSFFNFSRQN